jgi:molybdopterin-guanine dinucleotide biosynthesis protein A
MSERTAAGARAPDGRVGRVLGVILAGGLSRRMGADKGSLLLRGKPLISHAIDRLGPQVGGLVINANGDPQRYQGFGCPVIADTLADHPGPLAGVLAAMRWVTRQVPDVTHVATVPVDTPFFPLDLVVRLTSGLESKPGARLAFAATCHGPQPVFALVDVGLAEALDRDIIAGGARRVGDWLRSHSHVAVPFETGDAFFNVNTPADLAMAEGMIKAAR